MANTLNLPKLSGLVLYLAEIKAAGGQLSCLFHTGESDLQWPKLKTPSWIKVLLRHKRDSSEEFAFLFFFGLMPVWLGTVINYVVGKDVTVYLKSYLYSGEALLISAATIGPLIYLIFKDYEKRQDGFSKSFPGSRVLALTILVICLVSACILGLKSGGVSVASMSADALWFVSFVITLVSILVWFAVITIKNSLEYAAPQVMRQDTTDFLEEWRA